VALIFLSAGIIEKLLGGSRKLHGRAGHELRVLRDGLDGLAKAVLHAIEQGSASSDLIPVSDHHIVQGEVVLGDGLDGGDHLGNASHDVAGDIAGHGKGNPQTEEGEDHQFDLHAGLGGLLFLTSHRSQLVSRAARAFREFAVWLRRATVWES